MEAGNQSQVKAIFSRSLLNCLNLALWQTYLRFIKQVGSETLFAEGRDTLVTCDRCTLDLGSNDVHGPSCPAGGEESVEGGGGDTFHVCYLFVSVGVMSLFEAATQCLVMRKAFRARQLRLKPFLTSTSCG